MLFGACFNLNNQVIEHRAAPPPPRLGHRKAQLDDDQELEERTGWVGNKELAISPLLKLCPRLRLTHPTDLLH